MAARLRFAAFAVWAVLLGACSRLEPLVSRDACRRTEVVQPTLLPERVEWIKSADDRDHHALDLWCETVGPAVLLPEPSPADSAAPAMDSVAVLAWNVHALNGDVERVVRDLRGGRFTNGDSVHHFVLLLQEAYRESDSIPASVRIDVPSRIAGASSRDERRDVVALAYATGLSLLYVPSMRNGAACCEDRGNAVLASLTLRSPKALDLPFERQRRVAVMAAVEGTTTSGRDWRLTVASVHLDNYSRPRRIGASIGAGRLRQARSVIAALEDENNVLVGGDFNTWAAGIFEQALPAMQNAFEDTPEHPEKITYVKGRTRRRIDYMFFRLEDGWRVHYDRLPSRFGSDHYPLLGWVVMERNGATAHAEG